MSNKNEIISKVNHELSGYGSMNETTKDAKAIDNTITFKDVKERFANDVNQKSNVETPIQQEQQLQQRVYYSILQSVQGCRTSIFNLYQSLRQGPTRSQRKSRVPYTFESSLSSLR